MFRHLSFRLLACMLGAAMVAGVAIAQIKAISIATGGTGGVYYPLGGGLANVLSKEIPGLQATAEVTAARSTISSSSIPGRASSPS